MRISEQQISEIRNLANISDVIGQYIPLEVKGRSVRAQCPFHDDHDPSLSISTDKQIYRCFVCGNAGNVFTFVQNFEKCGFVEAVIKVANFINYPLDISLNELLPKVKSEHVSLHNVLNETVNYLSFQLGAVDGKQHMEYLNKRNFSKEIITKFNIGYNGLNNQLSKFLLLKNYSEADLIATNIARLGNNNLYDVFNDRIVFPIHNEYGQVIAFSARSIRDDQAKYINTSDSVLYRKGNVVYNYHRAKDACKKNGFVIVVEGVVDVIAFDRCKIENVVATLGTACTIEQLKLIKKLSSNIQICYDGDKAGKNATYKLIQLAKENNIDIKIITNNTQYDPDDIVNKFGADELIAMSKKVYVDLEFTFDYLKDNYNLENYSEKKLFTQQIESEINKLKDDYDRQNFSHKLYLLTGYKMTNNQNSNQNGSYQSNDYSNNKNQRNDYNNNRYKNNDYQNNNYNDNGYRNNENANRLNNQSNTLKDGKTNAEYEIISQMLLSKSACEVFKCKLGYLSSEITQKCAIIIIDSYRLHNKCLIADLLDIVKDQKCKDLLLYISNDETFSKEYDELLLLGSIRRVKRAELEETLLKISEKIRKLTNPSSCKELLIARSKVQLELKEYINEEN